ncbi:MAG: hypothetical protein A2939_01375 [Parcubacteria group bacterium RIFCSPLOWO2_01_FULL_48_18]|nr:MAG: hypothetical protein A2939_01375 [Parcubacteria group bacterium RIFCSPLOWO2_01_FULL_48_18]OHB22928.1 MAG: hypothetical protein A3J67_00965 [Parcubacteria group bacterium RIFCSPHIGHO2_02_FULL_48_10b]
MKLPAFFQNIQSKNLFLRVSAKEKILFAQSLAIMIKSGMALLDSLRLNQSQTKSKSFRAILGDVMVEIDNGQFLSTAVEKYKSVFDEVFVNIIRVGEASGTLSENLEFLAKEMGRRESLKKKIKAAMIYPTVVIIATIGVVWLLTAVVLPKILPIFEEVELKLPATTKILIAVTEFVAEYNVLVLVMLAGIFIGFRVLLKVKAARFVYQKMLLYVPAISGFTIKVNMAFFTRTLAILLKSGVKIVEALTITASSLNNLVYQRELEQISDSIRSGESISAYLNKNERMFPSTLARLIEVGENTGHLDENLNYLAEFYDNEVEELTKNISSLVEPVILVVMGGIVGFIALSIITPLFQLSTGGI